jgi:hypothetical protein
LDACGVTTVVSGAGCGGALLTFSRIAALDAGGGASFSGAGLGGVGFVISGMTAFEVGGETAGVTGMGGTTGVISGYVTLGAVAGAPRLFSWGGAGGVTLVISGAAAFGAGVMFDASVLGTRGGSGIAKPDVAGVDL